MSCGQAVRQPTPTATGALTTSSIHVRLQAWLPFTVQVYVNGREWLAQQMVQKRLGGRKEGTFVKGS
jgi:hypothetical protein